MTQTHTLIYYDGFGTWNGDCMEWEWDESGMEHVSNLFHCLVHGIKIDDDLNKINASHEKTKDFNFFQAYLKYVTRMYILGNNVQL